jgi:hypothetical protein
MSFSQGWDAGFKSALIFIGVVFVWLGVIEPAIPDRSLSELLMSACAGVAAIGFFLNAHARCRHERAAAEKHMAAAEAQMRDELESF